MNNKTVVVVTHALSRAEDFTRRYPLGKSSPDEADEIRMLCQRAMDLLAKSESEPIGPRPGFLWEPS